MVKFEVSKRHWVGDWWWIAKDEEGNALFYSPLSFEHPIQAFTEANRIRALLGGTTEVATISEVIDTTSVLV